MKSLPSFHSQPWEKRFFISERHNEERKRKGMQKIGDPAQKTGEVSHNRRAMKGEPSMTAVPR